MIDNKTHKNSNCYSCINCSFYSANKNDYNRHLTTRKHTMLTDVDGMLTKKTVFTCDCGKEYKFRQSLHVHKQKCSYIKDPQQRLRSGSDVSICETTTEIPPDNELVSVLLKQNNLFQELILKSEEEKKEQHRITEEEKKQRDTQLIELHQQFLEAMKNGSLGNTTNNNSHNTQNNQFNLQFYLNNTCKDALNLDEFLKSIKLTTQDYVNTGEVGFIQGLTDIFRKELHKLEPHHRPLQCTDVKREVIYVKENDEWTTDIENKKSLNIVRRIDLSYQNMMYKWMEENPGYRAEEGQLVEDGIKYSVVCFGRNRLDGNEPIFRGKILKNVLEVISIKRGSKVITVK